MKTDVFPINPNGLPEGIIVAQVAKSCDTPSGSGGSMDWTAFKEDGSAIKLTDEAFTEFQQVTKQIAQNIEYRDHRWDLAAVRQDSEYDQRVYVAKRMDDGWRCSRTILVDPDRFHFPLLQQAKSPALLGARLDSAVPNKLRRLWLDYAKSNPSLSGVVDSPPAGYPERQWRVFSHVDELLAQFENALVLPNRTCFVLHDLCFMQGGGIGDRDSWHIFKKEALVAQHADLRQIVIDGGISALRQFVEQLMDREKDSKWTAGGINRTNGDAHRLGGR